MTHDELIAETGMALCENAIGGKRCPCREAGTFACADEYPGQQARAAIRVIAPAVLEEAAEQFEKSQMSWRWGTVVAQDLRALKTRYEQ